MRGRILVLLLFVGSMETAMARFWTLARFAMMATLFDGMVARIAVT
jgi:hypothetical protein